MAGSLKYGQATASLVAGKWSAASRQNTLAAALKEWGTLRCTIRAARHLSDPAYRRKIGRSIMSPTRVGDVYLGASALTAPTAGGLGALEAALVAGLTGAGMQAAPAVSAVLRYRLATYWLPVAPGRLCWRLLQRREYI